MILTREELFSPTLKKLREHLEAEVQRLREYNDTSREDSKTEHTRGRIKANKDLLELVTYKPPPQDEE